MHITLNRTHLAIIATVLLVLLVVSYLNDWRWLMVVLPLIAVFTAFLPRK